MISFHGFNFIDEIHRNQACSEHKQQACYICQCSTAGKPDEQDNCPTHNSNSQLQIELTKPLTECLSIRLSNSNNYIFGKPTDNPQLNYPAINLIMKNAVKFRIDSDVIKLMVSNLQECVLLPPPIHIAYPTF